MPRPHVFVTRGSLLNFACDAWLLPTDSRLMITSFWRALPGLQERVDAVRTAEFARGEDVALPLAPREGEPTPVLTAVPPRRISGPEDSTGYAEVARRLHAFVERAAGVARAHPVTNRPLPLLAVPVFASAGGGSGAVRDALLVQQLRVLREAAEEFQVDIALVTRRDDVHAFAQSRRRAEASWPELTASMLDEVHDLAGRARAGRLVPFLGAGASVSAGGPSWGELLQKLAARIELDSATASRLADKNILDQASYLATLFDEKEPGSFARAVADEIGSLQRYGLAPALLTAIDSEQAITLNYDRLFETAAADAGTPRSVIPGVQEAGSERWLLKLHGTVDDPSSIVLTRDDYLGFDSSRRALSAIVQATLATRHLLFVGFGLTDDHFHEIVHDVRRAFPSSGPGDLATALTLFEDPLDERLWQGRLRLVPMLRVPFDRSRLTEAARLLEIFLDALGAFATDAHSYLLADGHESALSPAELRLRERLASLVSETSEEERATGAWAEVAAMGARLGAEFPRRAPKRS
ncbi:SIR2 family protein [Rathayibacter sp. ZW T2_19]|uniref:SIR2 family protein n=1 Tax=Rathayibacter rubneri TaxID=2950106 RepID=A0A9X2E4C3_9MICO|nr:SIR2 family protein [Rathayibacter rubneri]MCM6764089.1 SIR2 family protein [Rathayibacter rubneri]